MVSPTWVSATCLMLAVMKPISPGPSASTSARLGGERADPVDLVDRPGRHHADLHPARERAVADPHQDDHSEKGVVPGIDQKGAEGGFSLAFGRRKAFDQRLQHLPDPLAGLGRDGDAVLGAEADHVLDLSPDPIGLGSRQVDLVEDRDDLVVRVDREIDVGERLRLDPLGRVDHQDRALAGGKRARDLVGEIDVAGRVHQVQLIGPAIPRLVGQAHGLRLDGDAALAFEIHGVEELVAELALVDSAAGQDQTVGQRRLTVIDMGDDCEIADMREIGHPGQPRSTAPVALETAATIRSPTASISASVRVASRGCRVTQRATDFLSAPSSGPR